ncbi:methyl-accepting chemotaxis protein [Paludibacterium yongneupense]|uniref:methyl-accepting chemotaxis protein n=1 Tax=Paludibacterium yongneupense TaxID=400061 RepID=UPI00040363D5|nr:methyl-accepting chemotaxis protein [Paludibacterium yongneupense]
MTITKRLFITLSIALLGMLAVGGYGVWQLRQAQSRLDYFQVNTVPSLKVMNDSKQALTTMRVNVLKYILTTEATQKAAELASIADADKAFDAAMADYLANDLSNDADKQLLDIDKAAASQYRTVRDRAIALSKAGKTQDAVEQLLVQGRQVADNLTKALEDHYKFNTDLADAAAKESTQQYQQALLLSAIIIGGVFIASGLLAAHLYRSIRGGLEGIQATLEHVSASRDFTTRAKVSGNDEIGRTAQAFNTLLEGMQSSLKSLLDGAHQVASASQELSQTAGQVSSASAAQSESAANMAATVEEMTVSVNHVADQARATNDGAAEAGKLVDEGSSTIGQTIKDIHEISSVVKISATSIHELEADSGKVRAVIDVIRDIADQTNLLALNAAIEAARAGETGRGFAVVADEVRKLAERTAKSTQEISTTIEAMVAKAQQATNEMKTAEQLVETGVARADDADQAIRRIGDNVSAATQSISAISAAIREQGVASNSIASQVEQTAQMSEQSSAAAQHTAQSATRLDHLARSQIETLGHYRI